jgi:flagellar protein FlbD
MIQLTRLNNQTLVLNADLVKFVEQSPDTVITLVNGEKFIVRESVDEVVERILKFRCSLVQGVFTPWNPISGMPGTPDSSAKHPQTAPER